MVAPIRVTSPSSTAGSSASCWALLKRWISSRKKIVGWPLPAPALGRALDHLADLSAPGVDRRLLLEGTVGGVGDDPRQRRLAGARRPVEDHRVRLAGLDRRPQARSGAEQVLLADQLVERARAHPHREGGSAAGTGVRAVSSAASPASKSRSLICSRLHVEPSMQQ